MKTIDRTKGTQRHDDMLLRHYAALGFKLGGVPKVLARTLAKYRVRDSEALLAETTKTIEMAEEDAGHLFEVGAEWLRKYNALETLFGPPGKRPDMERFAALLFAYTRFFETGLPAFESIRERIVQCEPCEACRKSIDLPWHILASNLDLLHQALRKVDTELAQQVRPLVEKEG